MELSKDLKEKGDQIVENFSGFIKYKRNCAHWGYFHTLRCLETVDKINSRPIFLAMKTKAKEHLDRVNNFTPSSYRLNQIKKGSIPWLAASIGIFNMYQACKDGFFSNPNLLKANFTLVGIIGCTLGYKGLKFFLPPILNARDIIKEYQTNAQHNYQDLEKTGNDIYQEALSTIQQNSQE